MPAIAPQILQIARDAQCNVFVESGTFRGQSFRRALESGIFERCYTVEIVPRLYEKVASQYPTQANRQVFLGKSHEVFRSQIFPLCSPDDRIFFWLDGHFSGGHTGGAESLAPLLDELEAIRQSCPTSSLVIAIDDSDDLGKRDEVPGHNWPTRAEVVTAIDKINPNFACVDYTGKGALQKVCRGVLVFSYRAVRQSQPSWARYLEGLAEYRRLPGSEARVVLHPCLDEKTAKTPLDKFYFYQDTWAFRRIVAHQPRRVVDIGSTALLVGAVSCLFPTVSIDVRPLPVSLPGLTCLEGSITAIPLGDNSIELLSSLCVIEHIGLGRYGDPLDPLGSIKAVREVVRVVQPGGHFLMSVPVSHSPVLCFNAHRIFAKSQVLEWMPEFSVEDEAFLFPEPGPEERVGKQFCVWCADLVRR